MTGMRSLVIAPPGGVVINPGLVGGAGNVGNAGNLGNVGVVGGIGDIAYPLVSDLKKEISQAYADMRHYAELGDSAKVEQLIQEKGDKIAMAKFYDNASKDMAKVRQAIQAIRNDEQMSGAQKKEEIDRLKVLIGEIARQMEEARLMVKKSYAAQ